MSNPETKSTETTPNHDGAASGSVLRLVSQIVDAAEKSGGRISCCDFRDVVGCPDCCGSCHVDAEKYGYSLRGALIPTSRVEIDADVCCTVGMWIDEVMAEGLMSFMADREELRRENPENIANDGDDAQRRVEDALSSPNTQVTDA